MKYKNPYDRNECHTYPKLRMKGLNLKDVNLKQILTTGKLETILKQF